VAITKLIEEMSTDDAWEQWGQRDPYFGVITDPKFRLSVITEETKRQFFESGAVHVSHVLATIRKHIDTQFAPRRVLDFGCGVGRLLVPLAAVAEEVLGVDVSPSMLQEAQRNCDSRGLRNVRLLVSNDELAALTGTFDLIHSAIVFQHIPVHRGRAIFSKLLGYLRPGGVGAIHLTYSKVQFAGTYGVPPPAEPQLRREPLPAPQENADPEIQMNPYNVNEVLFSMQSRCVRQCHLEFSDHGGELGVFLFFRAPSGQLEHST
jgi:SAM-dependent methyltransferase